MHFTRGTAPESQVVCAIKLDLRVTSQNTLSVISKVEFCSWFPAISEFLKVMWRGEGTERFPWVITCKGQKGGRGGGVRFVFLCFCVLKPSVVDAK